MLRALSVSIMVFVMTSWSSSDEASSAQSQPLLCKCVASGVHVAIPDTANDTNSENTFLSLRK